MTWSQEISELITSVDQLTSATNVKKSDLDTSVASTESDKNAAEASIVSATASFASASTKAQEAEAHKNTALAVYGTTSAQQTAVASAQASASLASGYAASASAALQQDLSGVAAALHRSPNAVTSIFIYDTSKDSDGGAWTEKCQNTSWYNEPIMGKWLGSHTNESNARYEGATLGASFGDIFSSAAGYTVSGGAVPTVSGGWFQFNPAIGFAWASKDYTTVVGRRYRVTGTFRRTSTNATFFAGTGSGAANLGSITLSNSGTFILYFTASTTTSNVGLQTTNGTLIEFQLGNIVEVLSANTTSGDYYQSTFDGRFYRLWKNLLTWSEGFNNAAWSTRAGATVLPDTVVAPDGTMTADTITFTTSINDGLSQNLATNAGPNGTATFSVWARVESGTRVFRLSAYNGGIGTNTSGDFTATTTWQRFSFTTFFPNALGVQQCNIMNMGSSATVGNLIVWGAQLEHGPTATAYEPKTTISTITEVFRGNKRDFPRLAGIVAEGANVNIYDLTEPGRPMWMRFISNNSVTFNMALLKQSNNLTCIAAREGKLIALSSTNSGYQGSLIDFPVDTVPHLINGTPGVFAGRISDRNSALGRVSGSGGYAITGTTSSGVAMTVLPNAPTDPVTGLKVPTIAIGTNSGVSIIQNTGVINTIGTNDNQRGVAFIGKMLVVEGVRNTVYSQWTADDVTKGTAAIITARNPGRFENETSVPAWLAPSKLGTLASVMNRSGSYKLALSKIDRENATRSLYNHITEKYNTGWLPGDMRRVYLADTDVGLVTGSELITNGAFDTDISEWTSSRSAVLSYDNGSIRVTSGGTVYGKANQIITTVVGQLYVISFTAIPGTATCALTVGTTLDGYNLVDQRNPTSPGTRSYIFRATTTTTYVGLQNDSAIAGVYCSFDNVSVREAVYDNSYKAKGLPIFGTLTRSQVASGTSLVGYSGFAAGNYLRESYSADLDFGTGEWSASAWFNTPIGSVGNHVAYSNQPDNAAWTKDSGTTVIANKIIPGTVSGIQGIRISGLFGAGPVISCEVKAAGYTRVSIGEVAHTAAHSSFDLSTGTKLNNPNFSRIEALSDGWYRISMRPRQLGAAIGQVGIWAVRVLDSAFTAANNPNLYTWTGNGTDGILVRNIMVSNQAGDVTTSPPNTYIETAATAFLPIGQIFERSFTTGASIKLGINASAQPVATVFDGTNTRTLTSGISYDANQWTHIRVNYTTDGSLAIRVNGREIGVTRGNPLLTLNNTSAVLTVGNSFTTDGVFPGSIALLKLGATVPTAEQSAFMYEQEKPLFRANTISVLPDATTILDASYDDVTDRWAAVSATNESYWTGLVRNSVTPVPTGSYSKITTASGIELAARITANPGVDVTIPAYVLREELVKRSEPANKLNRQIAVYDYIGGFTGNIVNGSTAIASVTNLTYPVSPVGARISGTGIPANTTITAVSGTTMYISAAATATTTGLVISFLDFELPVGFETESVTTAGVVKQEGSTKDYTRLFDGFIETIRFGVAPGATTWVRIQATKSIQ